MNRPLEDDVTSDEYEGVYLDAALLANLMFDHTEYFDVDNDEGEITC